MHVFIFKTIYERCTLHTYIHTHSNLLLVRHVFCIDKKYIWNYQIKVRNVKILKKEKKWNSGLPICLHFN